MKIPKVISKNNHEYIFTKQYPNYVLYVDLLTGVKECFSYHELGMIKDVLKGRKWRNLRPERVCKY